MRPPKQGNSTDTAVSVHLSNTAAKRRDVAKHPLDQLRKVAEEIAQTSLQVTSTPRLAVNAAFPR